ncbi:hypothetical protein [Nocardia colli]|uniref:hypothetical protein n=1 Tax=Nocardia colli TaxID=2545717 RepID=UPI0035E14219
MIAFEELRQRVTAQATRAGYGLKRRNVPPYGWILFTASTHEDAASGTLEELEIWLTDQQADTAAGSDRQKL